MGMYDTVRFAIPCPECGEPVSGFQSKDGPCELLELQPHDVSNFYAPCRSCETWIEFTRQKPQPHTGPLPGWDMETRKPNPPQEGE